MEDLIDVPTHVRGAFFVSSADNDVIDLTIKDPLGGELKIIRDRNEGLFYFDAIEKGTYEFFFKNHNVLFNISNSPMFSYLIAKRLHLQFISAMRLIQFYNLSI
jgi:hypothetical protein